MALGAAGAHQAKGHAVSQTFGPMMASELIRLLQAQIKKNGDVPMTVVDSHANSCEVGEIEFLKYAHPTVVINTQ